MSVRVRTIYWDLLEQGIAGDDAATIAQEDVLRHELAVFISQQPAHNAPMTLAQLGEADG